MPDGSVFLGDRLLRRTEVEAMIAVSTATLYKMIKEGRFPASVHLGSGTVRWRLSEVQAWLSALTAGRQSLEPAASVPETAVPPPPGRRRRGRPPKRLAH